MKILTTARRIGITKKIKKISTKLFFYLYGLGGGSRIIHISLKIWKLSPRGHENYQARKCLNHRQDKNLGWARCVQTSSRCKDPKYMYMH